MHASARSLLRTSCVSLFVALAVFPLLETSARVYLFGLAGLSPTRVNSVRGLPRSGLTQPSAEPRLGFELRPNLDAWFKLVPFRTNAAGQRDREYARAKPPGTFRVAVADRWARAGPVADHAKLRASLREASLDAGGEMSGAAASAPAAVPVGTTGGMPGGMSGK